jgi:hypothetical protein
MPGQMAINILRDFLQGYSLIIAMNSITNLSAKELRQAADLKDKITSLQTELSRIFGTSDLSPAATPKRKFKMSASGRAKIAAAQKKRWAKVHVKRKSAKVAKKSKRRMSAAAKSKLAALARARWAKVKAAGKKRL